MIPIVFLLILHSRYSIYDMGNKSNNQGRAYEFACLYVLEEEISKFRTAKIIRNSSYFAAERAWNNPFGFCFW